MKKSLAEIQASQKKELPFSTYLLIAQDLLKVAISNINLDSANLTTLPLANIEINYSTTLEEYISVEINEKRASNQIKIIPTATYIYQIFTLLSLLSKHVENNENYDQRCIMQIEENCACYLSKGYTNSPETLEELSTYIRVINDERVNTPFKVEDANEECNTPCNTEEAESHEATSMAVINEQIFSPRGAITNILEIFSPRSEKIVPHETLDNSDCPAKTAEKDKYQQSSFSAFFRKGSYSKPKHSSIAPTSS